MGFSFSIGALNLDERGYGASLGAELDLFAGVQIGGDGDTVGSSVKAALEGGWAGQFKIVFYSDASGNIIRGEFVLSGAKDWGINFGGTLGSATDSTACFTLIVDRDQLATLANDKSNIANLSKYISSGVSETVTMGPTRLKEDFVKLFKDLSAMQLSYRVEEEKGECFFLQP